MVKVGGQELPLKEEINPVVLKITDYAEEILRETDKLKGWPEQVRGHAKKLDGKSEGMGLLSKLQLT